MARVDEQQMRVVRSTATGGTTKWRVLIDHRIHHVNRGRVVIQDQPRRIEVVLLFVGADDQAATIVQVLTTEFQGRRRIEHLAELHIGFGDTNIPATVDGALVFVAAFKQVIISIAVGSAGSRTIDNVIGLVVLAPEPFGFERHHDKNVVFQVSLDANARALGDVAIRVLYLVRIIPDTVIITIMIYCVIRTNADITADADILHIGIGTYRRARQGNQRDH